MDRWIMRQKSMKKKNMKREKKFTTKMQASLLAVFCGIIVMLILLMGVLLKIRYKDGERYTKRVLNQQTYVSSTIPYKRGDIVDRNGTVLATSVKVYNLILDVKILLQYEEYIDDTLNAISTAFDLNRKELETIMKEKETSSYVVLKKQIDSATHDKFVEKMEEKDSKIKAVWFEEEYKRVYPYDSLASNVIGFTVAGDIGTYGIEEKYNDSLVGVNGLSYGYFDSKLNLSRVNHAASNGYTVVSTIDANVQRIVEEKIAELDKQYPTKRISVLVMNPNNGDIYSMATNRQYDLNNPRDLTKYYKKSEIKKMDSNDKLNALYDIWRNSMVSDSFEPGSTFKPFTIAAALEESVIDYNDTYLCNGAEKVDGTTLHCNNRQGHGVITLTQAIMKSCNDALMQIGAKLGKDFFYRYQTSFLFGEKTNIDLPGEATGIIKDLKDIGNVDLAASSFGQTCEVTMMQLAAAFASLINGGSYYEPHVMKQIHTDTGAVVKSNDGVLVKQTISEETSEFLRNALFLTVDEGTAKDAKVEGYSVGGKTGTAQKYPRTADKFLLSFIGAVPMDDPEVLIYVTLDEVEDEKRYKDSTLATSFAGTILKEILPFLGVYPEGDIDYSVWGFDIDPKKGSKDVSLGDGTESEKKKASSAKEDKENYDPSVFENETSNPDEYKNNDSSTIKQDKYGTQQESAISNSMTEE